MNRREPSERSWTMTAVHFVAINSAVAATEHVSLWTSSIVRFFTNRILLPLLGAHSDRRRRGARAVAGASHGDTLALRDHGHARRGRRRRRAAARGSQWLQKETSRPTSSCR